ncbi:hypothetical protein C8Q80DRAFT_1346107 [Daedaleopsis nitida]|nr:hypothetical protein C8Q80DRAFT_1346107 [Daedaleopsis nitida]
MDGHSNTTGITSASSPASASAVPITDAKAAELLDQLQIIESLGGSAGFAEWLKDTQNGRIAPPDPATSEVRAAQGSEYPVTVSAVFGIVYFKLNVVVEGTSVKGNGSTWGIGGGAFHSGGIIQVRDGSLERLRDVRSFRIAAGAPQGQDAGAVAFMTSNGTQIAQIVFGNGNGVGGGISFSGEFKFSGF